RFGSQPVSQLQTRPPVVQAGFMFQPPAQPPLSDRSVRVVVEITKPATDSTIGAKTRVVAITDVTAPIVQRYRRVGDYVYGIVDGQTVLEAAVLPGDPFQNRAFGGVSAPHQAKDTVTANVVVMIPHMTRQQLQSRSIRILFYRLDPLSGRLPNGTRENITPARVG